METKSIKKILASNCFTLFNFLNILLAIAVFLVGSYKNMLFLLIVIINTSISTIQEIHAKKVIDKLSILVTSKAKIIKDGKKEEIDIDNLKKGDIIELITGDQIVTDSVIIKGEVQINQAFITGEPDNIDKKEGDKILSGSYIVSGKCLAEVEHTGEENYTSKITNGAKYIKNVNSKILGSLKAMIKYLTFAIVPIGLAIFYTQFKMQELNLQEAVVKSVAAIIGMIPEGLVLLTSTVLAVSSIRLSKSKVLVQELYCIETLARVDTLCFDKTGTLTEGIMEVKNFIPINNNKEEMKNILANIAKETEDTNQTMEAIKRDFSQTKEQWKAIQKVAFSSSNKWSGITFENQGSYLLGAPEVIIKENVNIKEYVENYRVLVLAHSDEKLKNKQLPEKIETVGYILLLDKIRKEAKQTIEYFKNQDVDLKIISGDNPITVSKISKQIGFQNYNKYIDMSNIEKKDIGNIVTEYSIFGRVTPTQKQDLIRELQKKEKTVAMAGDGVNDVLALKQADCSIAMANGSDATKAVSQMILLNSDFSSMPKIVAEGRRTINNIERSASLFLAKTIYSVLLAILFLFMGEAYPFTPIQMSLIGAITIGLPSFILALEPNKERIQGEFLFNIIKHAIPTSLTVALNIFVITVLNKYDAFTQKQYSSLCVISTGVCGIILLFTLAKSRKSEESKLPISVFRLLLAILITGLFTLGLTRYSWFFNISPLIPLIEPIIRIIIISVINFSLITVMIKKLF